MAWGPGPSVLNIDRVAMLQKAIHRGVRRVSPRQQEFMFSVPFPIYPSPTFLPLPVPQIWRRHPVKPILGELQNLNIICRKISSRVSQSGSGAAEHQQNTSKKDNMIKSLETALASLATSSQEAQHEILCFLVKCCSNSEVPIKLRERIAMAGLERIKGRQGGNRASIQHAQVDLLLKCGVLSWALSVTTEMHSAGLALSPTMHLNLRTALIQNQDPHLLSQYLLIWAPSMAGPQRWAHHVLHNYKNHYDHPALAMLVSTMLSLNLTPPLPLCIKVLRWLGDQDKAQTALALARRMQVLVKADAVLLWQWVALEGKIGDIHRAEGLVMRAMGLPFTGAMQATDLPIPMRKISLTHSLQVPTIDTYTALVDAYRQHRRRQGRVLWLYQAIQERGCEPTPVFRCHMAAALGSAGSVDGFYWLLDKGNSEEITEMCACFVQESWIAKHRKVTTTILKKLVSGEYEDNSGQLSSKACCGVVHAAKGLSMGTTLGWIHGLNVSGRLVITPVLTDLIVSFAKVVGVSNADVSDWMRKLQKSYQKGH